MESNAAEWTDVTVAGSAEDFKMSQKVVDAKETRFILGLKSGVKVVLSSFGATIVSILVPDAEGEVKDVVLGFDERAGYEGPTNPYFGSVVGRFANRIKDAKFQLDEQTIQLAKNNKDKHHLHGGLKGYSKHFWNCEPVANGVSFTYESPDGDEGYPGAVDVTTVYTLVENDRDGHKFGDLKLSMQGELQGGKSTPINLTNHSYFNLAGHDAKEGIHDHILDIDADGFTAVDDYSIPTRKVQNLESEGPEPMNLKMGQKFRNVIMDQGLALGYSEADMEKEINEEVGLGAEVAAKLGIDHNYCLNKAEGGGLQRCATLFHKNGRTMEVLTTAPGVQLYTANFITEVKGKCGATYRRRGGLCLETQTYPDAINCDLNNAEHAEFNKGACFILRAGNPSYLHETIYSFGWKSKK